MNKEKILELALKYGFKKQKALEFVDELTDCLENTVSGMLFRVVCEIDACEDVPGYIDTKDFVAPYEAKEYYDNCVLDKSLGFEHVTLLEITLYDCTNNVCREAVTDVLEMWHKSTFYEVV